MSPQDEPAVDPASTPVGGGLPSSAGRELGEGSKPAEPELVALVIRGRPAPQGSKRHVGGGRMIESSKAVAPWREAVRATTAAKLDELGFGGFSRPVVVRITFRLPRPRSHYGRARYERVVRRGAPMHPAGRPDLDKLLRSTLDGLVMGGLIRDDALVIEIEAKKTYETTPEGLLGALVAVQRARSGRR